MKPPWNLSRRHFLRGLGAAIALPSLDVMATSTKAASVAPTRLGFFFVPNGVNLEHWRPTKTGPNYELSRTLQPLASLKNDFSVLTGLTHNSGRANDDGAGDHARSGSVFLTGAQPLKSEGAEVRCGQSVDQVAADHLASQTRFGSLELGTETGRPYGKCDSGYSCGYSNNISWRDETTPTSKQVNPREVFERLFANEIGKDVQANQSERKRHRKSILDFVLEDANSLQGKVSHSDRLKLDEYLTSIREIEQRVERAETTGSEHDDLIRGFVAPEGVPDDFQEHTRLLGDMMVLAFQTDVTRVCSFMVANAGSNRAYREVGVHEGHHALSHHQSRPEKLAALADINRHHITQLAYILQRLKATKEGDGNLLDHSMIVYGSAIGDGNRHNHDDLPVLLAGHGNGAFKPGSHLVYRQDTPMCNLFNTMLDAAGVPVGLFGDSTGRLRNLGA
ncbi:MAG: DUF1552 domain-containing protein [Verrucomicrobiaceae bacterium]|nr:DUF1552 domain-containing protein [Verrucomicrobiaceae bacterium]